MTDRASTLSLRIPTTDAEHVRREVDRALGLPTFVGELADGTPVDDPEGGTHSWRELESDGRYELDDAHAELLEQFGDARAKAAVRAAKPEEPGDTKPIDGRQR